MSIVEVAGRRARREAGEGAREPGGARLQRGARPHVTQTATLIGGYYGSGKTVLIRRLLEEAPAVRTAVVVADVGGVGIDAAVLDPLATRLHHLPDGASCCTSVNGLRDVAERIEGHALSTDRALVELPGHVDPARVVAPGGGRAGIVTCADATRLERLLAHATVGPLVRAQLDSAAVIVLTRTALASREEVARARHLLRGDHPDAVIVADADASVLQAVATSSGPLCDVLHADELGDGGCTHRVWAASCRDLVDLPAVEDLLTRLPEGVVRVKGVVRATDLPSRRLLVDRVGKTREIRDAGVWAEPSSRSRLVAVGTGAPSELRDVTGMIRAALPCR